MRQAKHKGSKPFGRFLFLNLILPCLFLASLTAQQPSNPNFTITPTYREFSTSAINLPQGGTLFYMIVEGEDEVDLTGISGRIITRLFRYKERVGGKIVFNFPNRKGLGVLTRGFVRSSGVFTYPLAYQKPLLPDTDYVLYYSVRVSVSPGDDLAISRFSSSEFSPVAGIHFKTLNPPLAPYARPPSSPLPSLSVIPSTSGFKSSPIKHDYYSSGLFYIVVKEKTIVKPTAESIWAAFQGGILSTPPAVHDRFGGRQNVEIVAVGLGHRSGENSLISHPNPNRSFGYPDLRPNTTYVLYYILETHDRYGGDNRAFSEVGASLFTTLALPNTPEFTPILHGAGFSTDDIVLPPKIALSGIVVKELISDPLGITGADIRAAYLGKNIQVGERTGLEVVERLDLLSTGHLSSSSLAAGETYIVYYALRQGEEDFSSVRSLRVSIPDLPALPDFNIIPSYSEIAIEGLTSLLEGVGMIYLIVEEERAIIEGLDGHDMERVPIAENQRVGTRSGLKILGNGVIFPPFFPDFPKLNPNTKYVFYYVLESGGRYSEIAAKTFSTKDWPTISFQLKATFNKVTSTTVTLPEGVYLSAAIVAEDRPSTDGLRPEEITYAYTGDDLSFGGRTLNIADAIHLRETGILSSQVLLDGVNYVLYYVLYAGNVYSPSIYTKTFSTPLFEFPFPDFTLNTTPTGFTTSSITLPEEVNLVYIIFEKGSIQTPIDPEDLLRFMLGIPSIDRNLIIDSGILSRTGTFSAVNLLPAKDYELHYILSPHYIYTYSTITISNTPNVEKKAFTTQGFPTNPSFTLKQTFRGFTTSQIDLPENIHLHAILVQEETLENKGFSARDMAYATKNNALTLGTRQNVKVVDVFHFVSSGILSSNNLTPDENYVLYYGLAVVSGNRAEYSQVVDGKSLHIPQFAYVSELEENYLRKTDAYTKSESDNRYALASVLSNLSDYALKEEIPRLQVPDLRGFYTKTEADAKYALQASLPDLSGYYDKTESDAKYALQASLPDLSGYALKTELGELNIESIQKKLEEIDDLDVKSMREELVNLVKELANLKRQVGTANPPTTGELVQSVRLEQSISVRPNPASQYIEIDTPAPAHLKIIDPTGKVLRAEQIARGPHRISVQDLPTGPYLLLLQIGAEGTSYTFIKN
ncbi:MAG: T9SS type A sorting domain-containing protein [Cytophagales bacterium]|nr:T9SS type A sorting domain-containing protein [Cytophagales bacterium]